MSSDVRLRRLQSDYEAIRRLVHRHPRVEIEGVAGTPPERYRLKLRVRSLRKKGEHLEPADEHRLEVRLPLGYPRDAPVCRLLTPVFHPNIAPHVVCIGDHWTAGESLDAMVQRVGEMLAFQSYNTKSPLNGEAARWVDEHLHRLPTEREEFFVDLDSAPAARTPDTAESCSNCGAATADGTTCPSGHVLCGDCTVSCRSCGRALCLSCGEPPCPACGG